MCKDVLFLELAMTRKKMYDVSRAVEPVDERDQNMLQRRK